jgi:hypothetical protein
MDPRLGTHRQIVRRDGRDHAQICAAEDVNRETGVADDDGPHLNRLVFAAQP